MAASHEVPVLIAGGGPVGTTLALDLASRNIASVVLEARLEIPPNPKCNTTNARSMEHYRRLGCADTIRRVGLPLDRPTDVVYTTRWAGFELTRYVLRSSQQVLERASACGAIDDYWPTPEPQHRVSQLAMEPVLRAHAKAHARCDYREGWRFLNYTQHDDYVDCQVEDIGSGVTHTLRARYLVSCEGARSSVRTQMGTRLVGKEAVANACSTYIRSAEPGQRWPHKPGWMHRIFNTGGESHIVAINGHDTWLHHSLMPPDADLDTHDARAAIRAGFGFDFDYEVLGQERWTARAMVAERYRDRRVLLCGDAAHIWIPMGGFGMNAGVEDAVNLSWKLAATLAGWGTSALLDSYEQERKSVGQLVAMSAVKIRETMYQIPVHDPLYEVAGAAGDALRSEIGRQIMLRNVSEFDSIGMQLGVAYDASPIICYDGAQTPPFAIDRYDESSRPGVRAPHFWRDNGAALFDELGPEYSLLKIGASQLDVAPLVAAFAARRVPLKVLDIHEAIATEKYQGYALVLVRPDQHIAWRGHALPADTDHILNTITASLVHG